jgi:hypothetical protein
MDEPSDNSASDRPLSAEEILAVIRSRINQLDRDTQFQVGDLGELDSLLFNLHWLYAKATGRVDDFVEAARNEPTSDFLRYQQLTDSHEMVHESEGTQVLLDRWKKRGRAIGLDSN